MLSLAYSACQCWEAPPQTFTLHVAPRMHASDCLQIPSPCQQAGTVMLEQPVSDIAFPLQAARHAPRRQHAAATRCAVQMRSGHSRPSPPATAAAGSPAGHGTYCGRRRPLGWMRKPCQWLCRPCAWTGNAGRAPAQMPMLSPSPARSRSATMSQCTSEIGPRSPARRCPADPPWARPGTGRYALFRPLNIPARASFCCFCSTLAPCQGCLMRHISWEPTAHQPHLPTPSQASSCHPRMNVPAAEQSIGMQEEGEKSPPPPSTSSAPNVSEGPDGQPMLQLMCGEPGCSTAIWLRPDQLGLEPVKMEAMHLHQVGTRPAFLLSPGMKSQAGPPMV